LFLIFAPDNFLLFVFIDYPPKINSNYCSHDKNNQNYKGALSMLKKLGIALIAILGAVACGPRGSSNLDKSLNEGKALARVGDEKIHEGFLDLLVRVNPGIKAQLEVPMGKKRLVDNLIEQEMLYQESVKRGLDKNPEVKEKADLYRRVIISQSLIDDEVEKRAKDYYDKNKEKEFERVKVSQIFFSSTPKSAPAIPGKPAAPVSEEDKKKGEQEAEAKAKEAYSRLKNGEPWDKVVSEMSDDKSSASRGGDMGYLTRGDRRIDRLDYKGIVDASFSLAKGAYSQPILAKDGWHIIEVTEEKKVQPYDEVAMSIKFKIRGETKASLIAELKKKMRVQYLDISLAETMPAAPQAPMPMMPMMPKAETKPSGMEMKSVETKPTK
jgi:peptidyl-prolyl cis-trans isomerase C